MKRVLEAIFAIVVFVACFFALVSLTHGAQTAVQVGNGGTGIGSAPSYGQLLVGNGAGGYSLLATSSLGIIANVPVTSVFGRSGAITAQSGDYTTSLVPEGTNLYWTPARFDARLSATTSLPNITTLSGLSLPYSQITGTPSLTPYFTLSAWFATTSAPQLTTLANLALPVSQLTGMLSVAHGGTGSTTLTGILKGNGSGSVAAAIGNTDYQLPIALTTTGSSGAATFNGTTLNIPQYTGTPFAWTSQTYGNSTSTTLGFLNGLLSVGSTTINGNATTTGMQSVGSLFLNGSRFTSLLGTGLTNLAGALGIDLTAAFNWTGLHTFSGGLTSTGTTTLATTVFSKPFSISEISSGTYTGVTLGSSNLLAASTTGWNTYLGAGAGNTTGTTTLGIIPPLLEVVGNTNVGYLSGASYNSADFDNCGCDNTAVGALSLFRDTTGGDNTAVGYYALYNNTTGSDNTAFGDYSMFSFNGASSSGNTAIGEYSQYNNASGGANTSLGFDSLFSNTTGTYNTADSYMALYANTTGGTNTAMGDFGLYSNISGNGNVALGFDAGYNATSSSNLFFLGNIRQSSLASDKSYSLLYGTFAGAATSTSGQQLTVNGMLNVGTGLNFSGNQINLQNGNSIIAANYNGVSNAPFDLFDGNGNVKIILSPNATTTISSIGGGISIASGCFSVNGSCLTPNAGTVTSITANSPLTGGTISSSGSIGCQTASGSQAGCLSSADWTAFNGRQASLTFSYPLQNTSNTVSTAWGTTTPNIWGQSQTFSSSISINNNNPLLMNGSGNSQIKLGSTNSDLEVTGWNGSTDAPLLYVSNGNSSVHAGNIGIGTTSPAYGLSIDVVTGTAATSTVSDGSAAHPSCLQMYSPNGVAYAVYMANGGTLISKAGSCN